MSRSDDVMIDIIENEQYRKSYKQLYEQVLSLSDKVVEYKNQGVYVSRQTVLDGLQKEIENIINKG